VHMGDMGRARSAVRIIAPTTDDEWCRAGILIDELKEWDRRRSEALGFDGDEVIGVFYPDDIRDIRRVSALPEGCFLLAMDGNDPAGCAAYRRLTSTACEAYDVYVRPRCRGRGTGSTLLQRLMREAAVAGYNAMFLETATFMHDAHKFYTSFGFQDREPYRSIPAKFVDATIWMEYRFDERAL
jgi:GNAT superfamily N-acetyltransferase